MLSQQMLFLLAVCFNLVLSQTCSHLMYDGMQGNEEQKAEGQQVLADVLESMRIVAVLLSPIAPQLSCRMYRQLGFSQEQVDMLSADDLHWGGAYAAASRRHTALGGVQKIFA